MKAPASIACLPNGPYYLSHDGDPDVVRFLQREDGSACSMGQAAALCRCGGSKNKPFCDGTHATNGFSDARLGGGPADQRISFLGKRIAIHDNRALCAHAGACTEGLPGVFREDGRPWIDPDAATAEQVVETIRRCPSGALSYSIDGVEHRDREAAPAVTVMNNGPYAVSGSIELTAVVFGVGSSQEHYTLCRCGASKNKPFCDGSHWDVGFKDP